MKQEQSNKVAPDLLKRMNAKARLAIRLIDGTSPECIAKSKSTRLLSNKKLSDEKPKNQYNHLLSESGLDFLDFLDRYLKATK